jgi:hypothetical protein
MNKKQKTRIEFKRHLKITIALVCVVCFVAVFLLSSAHFSNHAQDHAESAGLGTNTCQRTLLPECECAPGLPLMPMQIQANYSFHSHSHSEAHVDCLVCVIIQKIVNQVRQVNASASIAVLTDTNIFAFFALCLFLALAGLSTPVKLKSRTNN